MKVADLLYMVNSIRTDNEFPLKELVIEFKLPDKEYLKLLGEVNKLIYKNTEYDYVPRFDVCIGTITFRVISE